MNKFSEAQIMNKKIEILRKNILTASVFSIAYEILENIIITRTKDFLSDLYDYRKQVLLLDKKERPL